MWVFFVIDRLRGAGSVCRPPVASAGLLLDPAKPLAHDQSEQEVHAENVEAPLLAVFLIRDERKGNSPSDEDEPVGEKPPLPAAKQLCGRKNFPFRQKHDVPPYEILLQIARQSVRDIHTLILKQSDGVLLRAHPPAAGCCQPAERSAPGAAAHLVGHDPGVPVCVTGLPDELPDGAPIQLERVPVPPVDDVIEEEVDRREPILQLEVASHLQPEQKPSAGLLQALELLLLIHLLPHVVAGKRDRHTVPLRRRRKLRRQRLAAACGCEDGDEWKDEVHDQTETRHRVLL